MQRNMVIALINFSEYITQYFLTKFLLCLDKIAGKLSRLRLLHGNRSGRLPGVITVTKTCT